MSISELALRLVISFLTLLLLTRVMGRKEISQMTFFNFVSAIALGTIGASLAIDSSISIRNGILALVGWSAITIVMGLIDIKSKNARKVIDGQPQILIKDGKIMESELRKARISIDTLKSLLRTKNVFTISDVDYAVFETSGKLSVMKKESKQSVTKTDMGILKNSTTYPVPTEVISDGIIMTTNLEKLNLDEDWLENQLQTLGVNSLDDVYYAEVQQDGTLYVDKRNDLIH